MGHVSPSAPQSLSVVVVFLRNTDMPCCGPSALSLRVFGEDITVAGRQAAAAAVGKQGTTTKQVKEEEEYVALEIEGTSFLRPTDRTIEGAPELKSGEEEKVNLSLMEERVL